MDAAEKSNPLRDLVLPVLFLLFGLGWMISLALRSPGMPVQDEIGHYNLARQAWHLPSLLLDQWGRPFNTLLYVLPARLSWSIARAFSILLSLVAALITWQLARAWNLRHAWLIPLVLFFQPWYASLGFTVLTEVPFNLLLVLGIFLAVRKREHLASACFGLLPLVRHEGMALLGIWILYELARKRFLPALLSLAPYAVYMALFQWILGSSPLGIFLDPRPTGFYGSGDWTHFLSILYENTGRLPALLALAGIPLLLRRNQARILWLLYPCYLLLHIILYHFGLYASGGYAVFLFPLAPGIALVCIAGLEFILSLLKKTVSRLKAFVWTLTETSLLVACALVIFASGLSARPHLLVPEEEGLQEAAQYLSAQGIPATQVYSTHQYFNYLYDLPYRNWLYQPALEVFETGSVIVWDGHYSERWGLHLDQLREAQSGYRRLFSTEGDGIQVFEKVD